MQPALEKPLQGSHHENGSETPSLSPLRANLCVMGCISSWEHCRFMYPEVSRPWTNRIYPHFKPPWHRLTRRWLHKDTHNNLACKPLKKGVNFGMTWQLSEVAGSPPAPKQLLEQTSWQMRLPLNEAEAKVNTMPFYQGTDQRWSQGWVWDTCHS